MDNSCILEASYTEDYCLEIGYREDLDKEHINPYYVELRNINRTDDETEKIIKWVTSEEEAITFSNKYIENNVNVKYFQIGRP